MGSNKQSEQNWKRDLTPYLTGYAAELLGAVEAPMPPEEIRIRAGRPIQLRFAKGERMLSGGGGRAPVSGSDCEAILSSFAEHSPYACEYELSQGFLTLRGGYRVGICGKTVRDGAGFLRFEQVSGFCIRIAREIIGASRPLFPRILGADGRVCSALLVSAPGCGKTTILRDAARALSSGDYGAQACSVGIVDARYELGGGADGTVRFDLGLRTDVLFGTTRAEGMRMMVRNLSPDVIVTDEIGTRADADAVYEAINSGAAVLASAHASGRETLERRKVLRDLIAEGAFERIVLLGRSAGTGTVERIWCPSGALEAGGEADAAVSGRGFGAADVFGGGALERTPAGAAQGRARAAVPRHAGAV